MFAYFLKLTAIAEVATAIVFIVSLQNPQHGAVAFLYCFADCC
jgi:hypothetical protein